MMPADRNVNMIRELQTAVLRRCEERIEKAGRSSGSYYHEAGRRGAEHGFTGGIRSRHGL
jgi:hypothetical protein